MKKHHKLTAVLLAAVMSLCMVPGSVFADEGEDTAVTETVVESSVDDETEVYSETDKISDETETEKSDVEDKAESETEAETEASSVETEELVNAEETEESSVESKRASKMDSGDGKSEKIDEGERPDKNNIDYICDILNGKWTGSYVAVENDGNAYERDIEIHFFYYDGTNVYGVLDYTVVGFQGDLHGSYYFDGSLDCDTGNYSFQGKEMIVDDGYYSHSTYSIYKGNIDFQNGKMIGQIGEANYTLIKQIETETNHINSDEIVGSYVGNHYGSVNGSNVLRESILVIERCSQFGVIEGQFKISPIEGAADQINAIYEFSGYIDLDNGNILFVGTGWVQYPDVSGDYSFQRYIGKMDVVNHEITGTTKNGNFNYSLPKTIELVSSVPQNGEENVIPSLFEPSASYNSVYIEFDKLVNITGQGSAYLRNYKTDEIVVTIPLTEENRYNGYSCVGEKLNLLFKKGVSKGEKYYITIDEGALKFTDPTTLEDLAISFPGLQKGEWSFTIVDFEIPSFKNQVVKIGFDLYTWMFAPIYADYIRMIDDGSKGICYGMGYTAQAWKQQWRGIVAATGSHSIEEIPIHADYNTGLSYLEYIEWVHLSQYMPSKSAECNFSTNKYQKIYDAVFAAINGTGAPVMLGLHGGPDGGHAVLPVAILSDTEEKAEIMVYDPATSLDVRTKVVTFYPTLTFTKTDNVVTGFTYRSYTELNYNTFDNSADEGAYLFHAIEDTVYNGIYKMVTSNQELTDNIHSALYQITPRNGGRPENDIHLYWTEESSLTTSESGEVAISDGYKEIGAKTDGNAEITLNFDEQSVIISNPEGDSADYTVTYKTADNYATTDSIEISGISEGGIIAQMTEDGLLLTTENEKGLESITASVDCNSSTVNTVDCTSSSDSILITIGDDQSVSIKEDTDRDGEYETSIAYSESSILSRGTCGNNVSWTLDREGALTISGEGEMEDYSGSNTPWYNNDTIKEAVIEDNVTSIGKYAFYQCSNLKSINIPESVTSIGSSAFYKCSSLESVNIPEGVTSIEGSIFNDCSSLTSINIPEGVKKIGDGAFNACTSVTSISIPNSVTSIGIGAFGGCYSLTSINIPEGVTSIETNTFQGCFGLTSVELPESIKYIGDRSFLACRGLESIYFFGDVPEFGKSCFSGVTANAYYPEAYAAQYAETATQDCGGNICWIPWDLETVDIASAEVTGIANKTFTGSAIKPVPTVKLGTVTLKSGTDYTVAYKNNTNAGTATVTITGIGNYTGSISKTFKITLAKPVLSTVSNVNGGVKFTWQKVNGAEKYRVFRQVYNASTKTWSSWAKVADTTAVSYTDKSVKSGTKYKYTARCVSSDGKTFTSDYDTAGKAITYVAAPTISSLTNMNSGVKITWGKSAGAAKYRVFRKTYNASTKKWSSWTKVADTASVAYTDTTVKNGTTYSYTIRCMNSSGSFVSAYNTTGKTITYVQRPAIGSLSSPKAGQMMVKWGKNASATGYMIQYSTSSSFASGNKTVTVKDAATVSKTISSLTAKKKYYVRVRTYKKVSGKNYYSAWSAAKNVTTK